MILPPVESDEQLTAHGFYRQTREGKSTSLQEFWSQHILPDGASIWRSQLLHKGVTPISACYLLRDPDFQPVQMIFYWRWQDGREDMVEYRFMPRYVTILYQDQVQDMILPAAFEVYGWHTITEHLLVNAYNAQKRGAQDVTLIAPGIQSGSLWPSRMHMRATFERSEIVPGPGGPHRARTFAIEMPDMGRQKLQFDAYGIPLKWALLDDQLAVELVDYVRLS